MPIARRSSLHFLGINMNCWVGGNSKIFFSFTPKIGEDEPILTHIFLKGVKPPTSVMLMASQPSQMPET